MGESALTSHGKGTKHQKLLANLREENRNKHHSLQKSQVVNLLQAQPHQQLPMNHQMHRFDPLSTRGLRQQTPCTITPASFASNTDTLKAKLRWVLKKVTAHNS